MLLLNKLSKNSEEHNLARRLIAGVAHLPAQSRRSSLLVERIYVSNYSVK